MTTFQTVPKTWSQLRAVGAFIRAFLVPTEKEREQAIFDLFSRQSPQSQKLLSDMEAYVCQFFDVSTFPGTKVYWDRLKNEVSKQVKALGPAGLLALSNLESRGKLNSPSALLALFVHVLVLQQENSLFDVKCVGIGNASNDDFDSSKSWPEIIPQAGVTDSDICFAYIFRCIGTDPAIDKSAYVTLKILKIGERLLVNVLVDETGYFSTELAVEDYMSVTDGVLFKERYSEMLNSFEPNSGGLNQFVSKAALSHLSETLERNIMVPVQNFVCPEASELHSTSKSTVHQMKGPVSDDFSGNQDDLHPGALPRLGPAYYGDNDLLPTLGPHSQTGGNLFGPGHPRFGNIGPSSRIPPGVPRGARFDPFSPPAPPDMPDQDQTRRSNRNLRPRGFGDEMPPPRFNDFGFYG